jgi:hypothetical protein
MSRIPFNYLKSKEFFRMVSIVGSQSIIYCVAIAQNGLTTETGLALLFGGIFGGIAIAKGDLDVHKNLYTPKLLPHRNIESALKNCAKEIAIATVIEHVIGDRKTDVVHEIADVLESNNPQEILDNATGGDFIKLVGRVLR